MPTENFLKSKIQIKCVWGEEVGVGGAKVKTFTIVYLAAIGTIMCSRIASTVPFIFPLNMLKLM